ncbi:hypothetical protein [Winogradskyella sp.]|uniref:hypothetical protein n=1 Tax=Winogradskyella sp. TaxID=1883156 RepID=UPI0026335D5C|nr:hypothetical protein [Winogradskyella sp.]
MILRVIAYLLWLSIGLYFGVGGYLTLDLEERKINAKSLPRAEAVYDGIEFKNIELAQVYIDEKKAKPFFSFIMDNLPKNLIYLITAMSFGVLGVITRITKETVIDKFEFKKTEMFFYPILGIMTGILILAISKIIPNLLVNSKNNVEPLTLAFFSLIAGFGSQRFYTWLTESSSKIFGRSE